MERENTDRAQRERDAFSAWAVAQDDTEPPEEFEDAFARSVDDPMPLRVLPPDPPTPRLISAEKPD